MRKIGDSAVILGAGMAGLLAARVAADAYERVTIVERDPLPEAARKRRGVPQGRHAHNLLPSGAQILGEFFPGLLADLQTGGALVIRDLSELRFAPAGHLLCLRGRPAQLPIYLASRPYLEDLVRSRVRELPAVHIVERCEAVGPVAAESGERVTGVRIRHLAVGEDQILNADLVVDATGRSGRTPGWLARLGYAQPPEQRVAIDGKYASRLLRLRPGALGDVKLIAIGATPNRPAGLVLFAQEQGQWILTLFGYAAHHPPTDSDGFLAFVESIAPSDVCAAIRDAEPLDDIVPHQFPADLRRRYERLRRFPDGLLPFGDAICSSNPAYALGMSVAALQAIALRDSLASGDRNLASRFFRAASKPIDMAWHMTVGTDLALPHVPGPRPLLGRAINAYITQALTAGERDPAVAEQFLRVAALQHPITHLFRPSMAVRVLVGNLPGRHVPTTIDAATNPRTLEEHA
jgi:2-polyprenyl-6-methoxyphenol hydroxylase-like FAD-dependent oxidoreductase